MLVRIQPLLVTGTLCLLFASSMTGQATEDHRSEIALTEAYELLEARYPKLQNSGIAQQLFEQQNILLDIAKRPTVNLLGVGQVQSQSVTLETPMINISQPLVNVKAYGEASYTILDGGANDARRHLNEAQLEVELQQSEADAFPLRGRINQMFIGISSLRERAALLNISIASLDTRIVQLQAGVDFGTVLKSEVSKLKVSQLNLKQERQSLLDQSVSLIAALESLTGIELVDTVHLIYPSLPATELIPDLERPEIVLLDKKAALVLAKAELTDVAKKPKLAAFAQAGIGYPNPLNFLDSGVAPYAVGGLKFSMPITDWGHADTEKQIQQLQAQQINNQRSTIEFDIDSQTRSYLADVKRLQGQLELDNEILVLQQEVTAAVSAQLDAGVATAVDYVNQLSAETSTRAQRNLHQTQLLQIQLDFLNQRGAILAQ